MAGAMHVTLQGKSKSEGNRFLNRPIVRKTCIGSPFCSPMMMASTPRAQHPRIFIALPRTPDSHTSPLTEQSAVGMKLTLRDDMAFQEHTDIAENIRTDDSTPLRAFSLDGSPCDCVIVAIDGGLSSLAPEIRPWLCISESIEGQTSRWTFFTQARFPPLASHLYMVYHRFP